MIIDHRPGTSAIASRVKTRWQHAAVFVLLFAVTVLLQYLSGAFHSEFAGYPDESAHYVTGLMVRDFLAGLHYGAPLVFARDYYQHYPKVAFGHWPPLLYIVEAVWMLVFSASRFSILTEFALLSTLTAWLLYIVVNRRFGARAGVLAGLLFVCLPITQIYSVEVMAESLLTLVSFAAVLYFAKYLEDGRWQNSLWFGIFAALAILTKGSGWDLAIVPPVAIFLTHRFEVLRKPVFWIPAAVVAILCGPWQVLTMSMAQQGWQGGDSPTLTYTLTALREFASVFVGLLGWGVTPVLLVGVAVTVALPYFRRSVSPFWATMFALIFAAWIFHSIVPVGVEPRKLVVGIPAMLLFLFAGGTWVAARLACKPGIVAAVVVVIFALTQFSIPKETHYGYMEAAQYLQSHPDLRDAVVLVSSEHDGEGMLISELAMLRRGSPWTILRGTKVLAKTEWNAVVLEDYYRTPAELIGYLDTAKIGVLVIDTLHPQVSFNFQKTLLQTVQRHPERFRLLGTFAGQTPGAVSVYRVL